MARGLKPFKVNDEWHYHIRFAPERERLTAILAAVPPERTRQGPDGPHSGNPTVRARQGRAEVLAWMKLRFSGTEESRL